MELARHRDAAGTTFFLALSFAFALPVFADAPDPAVFRLIPPDAAIAVGVDAARTQGSPINELFSLPPDLGNVDYYIRAEKNTSTDYYLFEIHIGDLAPLPAPPPDANANANADQIYRGIPLVEFSWGVAAQITPNIRIVGFEKNLREAIDRWLDPVEVAPFALSAAHAATDYNNWIVIHHPVDLLNDLGETRNLPGFIVNALGRVGEATGGVLIGPTINLYAELACDTEADASAIAALGSVLPTLLKTMNTDPLFTRLISLAQGFTVRANGNKVRAMAYLPAQGVQQIVDEMNGSLLQP